MYIYSWRKKLNTKHKNKIKRTFPKDFINKFLCGDTVQILRQIPDESLDLAITSPLYNIKNSTGNGLKDGRGALIDRIISSTSIKNYY